MAFLTIIRGDNFDKTFLVEDDGDPMDLSVVALARFTVKTAVRATPTRPRSCGSPRAWEACSSQRSPGIPSGSSPCP